VANGKDVDEVMPDRIEGSMRYMAPQTIENFAYWVGELGILVGDPETIRFLTQAVQ
jgi:hypothetical protein